MEKNKKLTLNMLNEKIACLETKLNSICASLTAYHLAYQRPNPQCSPTWMYPSPTIWNQPVPSVPNMDYMRAEVVNRSFPNFSRPPYTPHYAQQKSSFVKLTHPGVFARYGGKLEGKLNIKYIDVSGYKIEIPLAIMADEARVTSIILQVIRDKVDLAITLRGLVDEKVTPVELTFLFEDFPFDKIYARMNASPGILTDVLKNIAEKKSENNTVVIREDGEKVVKIFEDTDLHPTFASYDDYKITVRLENSLPGPACGYYPHS